MANADSNRKRLHSPSYQRQNLKTNIEDFYERQNCQVNIIDEPEPQTKTFFKTDKDMNFDNPD